MFQKIKKNKILVAIIVFAAVLRFYHIDFQSIWLDEIHTMNEANPNVKLTEVYALVTKSEQMPPLYFYLLYFLFNIFGYFTVVARIFSAVLGIAGVFSLYLLGKELVNKKVGLIAALLLCVNFFHINYSQEARPYILLVVFTNFSFYYLIKFLKQPNRKNAIIHGVFATLMIYSHFFGLFTLFSQYAVLLFFLLIESKEKRKDFLFNSFLSGVTTGLLFLPIIGVFLNVADIKEFWIQRPTLEVFTTIFKEFFGGFELIFPLILFSFIFFIVRLSKEKDQTINYQNVVVNKNLLSFVILLSWIVLSILVPLIRTYLSVPMLISRYFIEIIPAIILILAIGIIEMRNRVIRNSFIAVFVIFSLTDIFIIKDYYNTVLKTQFREATNFIIQNNTKNEPVVTSLGWYMTYFFKDKNITDKPLENYLNEIKQDSTKLKSFWYIDGHVRPYKLSDDTQKFVDNNFYIDNNYDGYDTWVKHFILLKDVPKVLDISRFKKLSENNGDAFNRNIEVYENENNILKISGWAFFDNLDASKTKIDVLLIKDGIANRFLTQKVMRPDIVSHFKQNADLSNSGFVSTYDTSDLLPGKYIIGLYLVNKDNNKTGLFITDKTIEK